MKKWKKSSRRILSVFLTLALCLNAVDLAALAEGMPADDSKEKYDLNINLPSADPEGGIEYPRSYEGFVGMLTEEYSKGDFVPGGTWSVKGTWEDGSPVMTIDSLSGDVEVFEPAGEKALVTVMYTYEKEDEESDQSVTKKDKESSSNTATSSNAQKKSASSKVGTGSNAVGSSSASSTVKDKDTAKGKTTSKSETMTMTWKVLFTSGENSTTDVRRVDNYGDLEDAVGIENAQIELTQTITISSDKNLELKGCTIKYTGEGEAFVIEGGTFTVSGSGTIEGDGNDINSERKTGSIVHVKGGTFELNGSVTITGGNGTNVKWAAIVERDQTNGEPAGGAVLVESGATFTMNGGTITRNSATWGGGIAVARGGKLNIYGGEISSNTATSTENDSLSGAAAGKYGGGGGIFCAGTGVIDPTKGDISIIRNGTGTVNDLGGGGIFIESKGEMKIYNAVVTENHADGQGGGVAGCLHSKVTNLSVLTAAIYGNTAGPTEGSKCITRLSIIDHNDWWYNKPGVSSATDYMCAGYNVVDNRSMNDGNAKWTGWIATESEVTEVTEANGNPITVTGVLGLSAGEGNDVESKADDFKKNNKIVTIENNTSAMHGGGIGCNGILSFGEGIFIYSRKNITLEATKKVVGKVPEDNNRLKVNQEFSLSKGDYKIGTAFSNGDGNIKFNVSTADVFGSETTDGDVSATLYLKEVVPEEPEPGMTYDVAVREITIEATRTCTTKVISTGKNGKDVQAYEFTDTINKVSVKKVTMGENGEDVNEIGEVNVDGTTITLTGDEVDFTNKMEYNNLKVMKKVIDDSQEIPNPNEKFMFTVKLGKGDTTSVDTPSSENGKDFVVDYQKNGIYTFQLEHEQTITITNIPVGVTYTVEEEAHPLYTAEYEVKNSGDITVGEEEEPNTVIVTNTRKVTSLTVTKEVDYDKTTSEEPTGNDVFMINVQLGDSTAPKTLVPADNETSDLRYKYQGSGIYVLSLKDTEKATIINIPDGTHWSITEELTEEQKKNYTNTNGPGPDGDILGVGGDLQMDEQDQPTEVIVQNHYYNPKTTDISVHKNWGTTPEEFNKDVTEVTVELYASNKDEAIRSDVLNKDNDWSASWTGLDLTAYTGDGGTEITYSVKEVSVKFGEDQDPLAPDDKGVIWVYGPHTTEEGEPEVRGAWIVSGGSVDGNGQATITNNWVPASDTGKVNFTIRKVDGMDPNMKLTGVEFTLQNQNYYKQDVTDENGEITFENLTDGTYTLTETTPRDGYKNEKLSWTIEVKKGILLSVEQKDPTVPGASAAENNWKLGVGQADGSNVMIIENQPISGKIKIYKTFSGIDEGIILDEDAVFTFEVRSKADGPTAAPVAILKVGKDGNGVETGPLRYGEYIITEVAPTSSHLIWNGVSFKEGQGSFKESSIIVDVKDDDKTYEITAKNDYVPVKDLTVTKKVSGVGNGMPTKTEFGFTVKLGDGSSDVKLAEGATTASYTENGKYYFELKADETFTITNIPVGIMYTVVENPSDMYTAKGEVKRPAAITTGKNSVEVTNTYTPEETTEPETTEPTSPEESTEPTTPEESTEPTTPEESTEPTTPEESTEPTLPEETTEPTTPEESTEPTLPEETTEPTTPEESTEPTSPEEPTEPTTPEEPTEPTSPENPTEPTTPTPETPRRPSGGGGDNPNPPPDNPDNPEVPGNPPDNPEIPDNPIPNPPPILPELPDPNDPNSPDTVIILENGVPTTYVKVQNPDTGEFMYIPDGEVPLFGLPKTGDENRRRWLEMLTLLSTLGIGALTMDERRRKKKEER